MIVDGSVTAGVSGHSLVALQTLREPVAGVIADERSDHEDVAVREVDQLQDAVHHRVAESDERVDRAGSDADQKVLQDGLHKELPVTGYRLPGMRRWP
jgi:hypothetical protein